MVYFIGYVLVLLHYLGHMTGIEPKHITWDSFNSIKKSNKYIYTVYILTLTEKDDYIVNRKYF